MAQAKVLSEKDVRKVLLYIASRKHATRNRAMFVLLNSTGMRVGELAALRLCDVLQSTGEIVEEIRLAQDQTKGSRGRTVVLSQKAQEEIKNYLQTRFKLKDLLAVTLTDTNRALFTTQKNPNRGFSASTLTQHFHYIYKGAGINGASSHSSRRSFITNLANMGVSVRVLMELAGHRSMAVTQRYIDVNPSMMRKAVELLG
jgi:integrase/recombinase XerD